MNRLNTWIAALCLGTWACASTASPLFANANIAQGQRLMEEHKCNQCHMEKVGGDGTQIYKPMGRLNTAGLLRGMVEQCNTALNLGMFPEEVTDVAAYLNQNIYKHK